MKVRSRLSQKGRISDIMNVNKNVSIRCSLSSLCWGERFYASVSFFFSRICQIRRRAAPLFLVACSYIFSTHIVKIPDPGRSGHQVTSSELTSESVWIFVITIPDARSPWNLQQLISALLSIKCISLNFNVLDPRSDQFYDLSIISQWEKNERRLFWNKTIGKTHKHQVIGRLDTLSRNIITSDPRSVTNVTSGHERSPAVCRQ